MTKRVKLHSRAYSTPPTICGLYDNIDICSQLQASVIFNILIPLQNYVTKPRGTIEKNTKITRATETKYQTLIVDTCGLTVVLVLYLPLSIMMYDLAWIRWIS